TVDGAMELLAAYLGWRSRFLSEDLRIEATTNQNGELGGGPGGPLEWEHAWWGLGPEMRNAKKPHWAPAEANPVSFGHAGMSGCLAWADPVAGVAWTF